MQRGSEFEIEQVRQFYLEFNAVGIAVVIFSCSIVEEKNL